MKLIFATQNENKVKEVTSKLGKGFEVRSLFEIGFTEELPETSDTLEGNALQKARYVYRKKGMDCFADDSGLEVEALNNEPGIFSARYAGQGKSSKHNIKKVLRKLEGETNRNAKFRTVLALIINGKEYVFTGEIEGEIIEREKGLEGFGYDPVFCPKGYEKTFAEMSKEKKNKISHRALALEKLVEFLNNL